MHKTMKKNDLSTFQTGNLNQLKAKERKKPGAPAKSKENKASKKVMMSFTPGEFKQVKEACGGIPIATFLRLKLQEMGLFV